MQMRYGWLGTTRKKAIRGMVSACLQGWLLDWCLRQEACESAVLETTTASRKAGQHAIWLVESAGGCWFTAVDEQQLDALGGYLAWAAAEESDGMAAALARAAMQDLAVRLAARMGHANATPIVWKEGWPESLTHVELGALGLQFSLDGLDLLIGMDRPAIDMAWPEQTHAPTALSSRAQSLGSLPVLLSAVLDFGSVNAHDLVGLRAGEVLVSERTIDQPVALRAGRRHVLEASLTRAGGHLAIVAAAPPSAREDL